MKKWIFCLAAALFVTACGNDDADVTNDNGGRIEIDRTTLTFPAAGDSFEVTVLSEGEWRLAGRKNWCHPSMERGENGAVVTFTADANAGYDRRSETFTFVCGSRTIDLIVSQEQCNLFDAGSKRQFQLGPEGGDVTLVVSSNLDYSYRIESGEWLVDHNETGTRGLTEDWLYFEVPANDTYGPREARIVFEAEGMDPVTVTVAQDQNVGIRLDPDRFEFQDIEAHRIEVEVLANVAYTVEIPEECDWVTLIENPGTRALESKTVAFDVAAGRSSRNVTVTFRQTDGDAEASLYISQFNPNAQLVSIPDANFREALLGDGFILDASSEQCELTEAGQNTTEINSLPGCGIEDLTGIEAFEKLETLFCAMNQITHLDLSKNLALQTVVMSYNPLEEIILGDVNLTTLSLSGSLMTQGYPTIYSSGVRVSSSKLQTVDVSNNSQLTLLDVSDCPALTTVKARNCKYGKMVIRMRRAQEGTVSVDKDYTAKIEYVD